MNDFGKKVIKYTVLYIAMMALNIMLSAFLPMMMNITYFGLGERMIKLVYAFPSFIFNIVFGIILFFDCRKEIAHYYSIPILGAFNPLFGTIFYFIERFLLNQNNNHD